MPSFAAFQVDKMTTAQVREVARYGFVHWQIEIAADLCIPTSELPAVIAECKRRVIECYANIDEA